MNGARKLWLRRFGVLAACGFVGSLVFMRFMRGQPVLDDGDLLTAVLVSLLLSSSFTVFEASAAPAVRRMRLLPAVIVRTAAYTVAAAGSVFVGILLANILQDGWERARVRFDQLIASGDVFHGCLFCLCFMLVVVFVSSVSQKLGPGVLWNWMLGRYHQPREERCVFLFLDLRGSTGLAERLGDKRFSGMIRDAFSDMTPALLDSGAQVSHFIGDGVVLYWPIRRGRDPDAAFARCFFAVQDLFERQSSRYKAKYGEMPHFKGGAHYGTVIATDVGQIKSEIVFHGDVLNVAARLEKLCSEAQADLLISAELASVLKQERAFDLDDRGERMLQGKDHVVRVFSVSKRSADWPI